MSSYNFHRTFSFIAEMTANEYIRSRRLTLAAQELHLFNPLVIKIIAEGGSIMDYRMEHANAKQFITLVKDFPNEGINADDDHGIPDFWIERDEKNLLEPMKLLRPEGKRDLYGLCSPTKANETHFNYGIGVIVDEDTDSAGIKKLLEKDYSLWNTAPADYAVFKCIGSDGDCIGKTWSKFYKEFSPQTGYVQTDDTDFEIYFEKGENGLFCELWVPVKKEKS